MYYTIVPYEVLYKGVEDITNDDKFEYRQGNRIFTLQKRQDEKFEIISMFSTDPKDYLNPEYAPGSIIKSEIDL